jgi:hypothetical protein
MLAHAHVCSRMLTHAGVCRDGEQRAGAHLRRGNGPAPYHAAGYIYLFIYVDMYVYVYI